MPILIPEAPVVNPNAALGTPPRLNSDGEADPEVEEILDTSEGTDEGMLVYFQFFLFFSFYLCEASYRLSVGYYFSSIKLQWWTIRKTDGRNTNTRWTWRRILATFWK